MGNKLKTVDAETLLSTPMSKTMFIVALVYRGTADGTKQFIDAQDTLIEELYAEPEEDPIEEGEAADPAAATPESEVTG